MEGRRLSGRLLLLADDHAVVRTGYRRLLELEDDMEVVADFADSDAACAWFASHDADVLVLDLSMPGRGGLETLARVKARDRAAVLVFSMHDNPAMVDQALRAGADGYLTKSSEPDALIDAVRRPPAANGRFRRTWLRPARPAHKRPRICP
jgi:DNA-binding NarL/FixJ family response regulator